VKADLHRLLEAARKNGWRVERTKGSHYKLLHPNGAIVFAGSTPGSPRALRHLTADLRRAERRETQP
jgi:hypothetical protein